jgi:hypothetical protein
MLDGDNIIKSISLSGRVTSAETKAIVESKRLINAGTIF